MIVKTLNISNELSDNDRVRLNTLIHPNEMGEKFKVMIFGKEMEPISFFNKFKDLSFSIMTFKNQLLNYSRKIPVDKIKIIYIF